jgi:hypothetical protein
MLDLRIRGRGASVRTTHAYETRQPPRLGEGVEHHGHKERYGQRQERPRPPSSHAQKKVGWRSAVVMVSPRSDLSPTGLFEDSFMIQPPSCAWLCCQTQCTAISSCLAWFLLLLTPLSSRLGSKTSVALLPPFPLLGTSLRCSRWRGGRNGGLVRLLCRTPVSH